MLDFDFDTDADCWTVLAVIPKPYAFWAESKAFQMQMQIAFQTG